MVLGSGLNVATLTVSDLCHIINKRPHCNRKQKVGLCVDMFNIWAKQFLKGFGYFMDAGIIAITHAFGSS
jgi:hypothetical protein